MSPTDYITIPVAAIAVPGHRSRSLDPDWAEALAAMFQDQGNKTPIEVRRGEADGAFVLVSGLHRLEAARRLEWTELTARLITAETEHAAAEFKLHEVMENLGRRELSILDRARHLHDFQDALYRLHPELKKGGNSSVVADEGDRNEILSLRSDISEKVGLSQRSIQIAVKLYKSLSKASRERIDGTWLADHQAGLMVLAQHKAKMQANILDVLFDPETDPKSVAEAVEYLAHGRLANTVEKKIGSLKASIAKLDDDMFDRVMSAHLERVTAWLDRKGLR